MTTEKDNGGPAFPADFNYEKGMTLRDWFAGQALVGLTSQSEKSGVRSTHDLRLYISAVGNFAYEIADAMISGRDK